MNDTTQFVIDIGKIIGQFHPDDKPGQRLRDRLAASILSYEYQAAKKNGLPRSAGRPPQKRESAVEFLRNALANGPVAVSEVMRLATEAGHRKNTIKRARAILQTVPSKDWNKWYIELPVKPTPTSPSSPPPEPAHSHEP